MKNKRLLGFILVISGAFFWGIGGTVAQQLFQTYDVKVGWLVTMRLLISGVLLLSIQALWKDRTQIFDIWRHKYFALRLVIFSIIGMLLVQYTYMASIDYGNAAVATLLQYLAPVMIIVYTVLRKQAHFTRQDTVTVTLALIGSFLLLTNGQFETLAVPMPAIVWGLLSGVSLAFYTLYAVPLLKSYDSLVIVGWAMLVAGVVMSIFAPPWRIEGVVWEPATFGYLTIVIIFGTMLAFWFFIESLQSLKPKETSLLGNIEPLTAVVATVVWLKEPFGTLQWVGASCILIMMIYLAVRKTKQ